MNKKPPRKPGAKVSDYDHDGLEELLRRNRGARETWLATADADLWLHVRHGIAMWTLVRPDPRVTRDRELRFAFWPSIDEAKALAEARRIKDADAARLQWTPPIRLAALIAAYDDAVVKKMRSAAQRRRALKQVLGPFGDRYVHEIAAAEFQSRVAELAATSKHNAVRCRSYLRALFRWSVGAGLLTADPTEGIPTLARPRARRILSLEELAEVWAAAEVLPPPYRQAIRLLILLPIDRMRLLELHTSQVRCTADRIFWSRPAPGAWRETSPPTTWKLSGLAYEQVSEARRRSTQDWPWLLSTRALEPHLNWAWAKRKVVEELNRRRVAEARRRQAPWHLNELPGSFAAIASSILQAEPDDIARCQDHLHRFRSEKRKREALSQASTDRACAVLEQWWLLIWASTSRPEAPSHLD